MQSAQFITGSVVFILEPPSYFFDFHYFFANAFRCLEHFLVRGSSSSYYYYDSSTHPAYRHSFLSASATLSRDAARFRGCRFSSIPSNIFLELPHSPSSAPN